MRTFKGIRTYQVIEELPKDILENVIDVVYSEIEYLI